MGAALAGSDAAAFAGSKGAPAADLRHRGRAGRGAEPGAEPGARAAADCAFRLDDRVRAERREMWFAATVIQARQRRNEWRGYYLLALRAATVFIALYRMWPVRRRYARLRNAAICVEASAHMFLARRPFLRGGRARSMRQKGYR